MIFKVRKLIVRKEILAKSNPSFRNIPDTTVEDTARRASSSRPTSSSSRTTSSSSKSTKTTSSSSRTGARGRTVTRVTTPTRKVTTPTKTTTTSRSTRFTPKTTTVSKPTTTRTTTTKRTSSPAKKTTTTKSTSKSGVFVAPRPTTTTTKRPTRSTTTSTRTTPTRTTTPSKTVTKRTTSPAAPKTAFQKSEVIRQTKAATAATSFKAAKAKAKADAARAKATKALAAKAKAKGVSVGGSFIGGVTTVAAPRAGKIDKPSTREAPTQFAITDPRVSKFLSDAQTTPTKSKAQLRTETLEQRGGASPIVSIGDISTERIQSGRSIFDTQQFSRGGVPIDRASTEGQVIERIVQEQDVARQANIVQADRFAAITGAKSGVEALEISRKTKSPDVFFTFGSSGGIQDGQILEQVPTRGLLQTEEGRGAAQEILDATPRPSLRESLGFGQVPIPTPKPTSEVISLGAPPEARGLQTEAPVSSQQELPFFAGSLESIFAPAKSKGLLQTEAPVKPVIAVATGLVSVRRKDGSVISVKPSTAQKLADRGDLAPITIEGDVALSPEIPGVGGFPVSGSLGQTGLSAARSKGLPGLLGGVGFVSGLLGGGKTATVPFQATTPVTKGAQQFTLEGYKSPGEGFAGELGAVDARGAALDISDKVLSEEKIPGITTTTRIPAGKPRTETKTFVDPKTGLLTTRTVTTQSGGGFETSTEGGGVIQQIGPSEIKSDFSDPLGSLFAGASQSALNEVIGVKNIGAIATGKKQEDFFATPSAILFGGLFDAAARAGGQIFDLGRAVAGKKKVEAGQTITTRGILGDTVTINQQERGPDALSILSDSGLRASRIAAADPLFAIGDAAVQIPLLVIAPVKAASVAIRGVGAAGRIASKTAQVTTRSVGGVLKVGKVVDTPIAGGAARVQKNIPFELPGTLGGGRVRKGIGTGKPKEDDFLLGFGREIEAEKAAGALRKLKEAPTPTKRRFTPPKPEEDDFARSFTKERAFSETLEEVALPKTRSGTARLDPSVRAGILGSVDDFRKVKPTVTRAPTEGIQSAIIPSIITKRTIPKSVSTKPAKKTATSQFPEAPTRVEGTIDKQFQDILKVATKSERAAPTGKIPILTRTEEIVRLQAGTGQKAKVKLAGEIGPEGRIGGIIDEGKITRFGDDFSDPLTSGVVGKRPPPSGTTRSAFAEITFDIGPKQERVLAKQGKLAKTFDEGGISKTELDKQSKALTREKSLLDLRELKAKARTRPELDLQVKKMELSLGETKITRITNTQVDTLAKRSGLTKKKAKDILTKEKKKADAGEGNFLKTFTTSKGLVQVQKIAQKSELDSLSLNRLTKAKDLLKKTKAKPSTKADLATQRALSSLVKAEKALTPDKLTQKALKGLIAKEKVRIGIKSLGKTGPPAPSKILKKARKPPPSPIARGLGIIDEAPPARTPKAKPRAGVIGGITGVGIVGILTRPDQGSRFDNIFAPPSVKQVLDPGTRQVTTTTQPQRIITDQPQRITNIFNTRFPTPTTTRTRQTTRETSRQRQEQRLVQDTSLIVQQQNIFGAGGRRGAGGGTPSPELKSNRRFFRVFDVARTPFGKVERALGQQVQSRSEIGEISDVLGKPKKGKGKSKNLNEKFFGFNI